MKYSLRLIQYGPYLNRKYAPHRLLFFHTAGLNSGTNLADSSSLVWIRSQSIAFLETRAQCCCSSALCLSHPQSRAEDQVADAVPLNAILSNWLAHKSNNVPRHWWHYYGILSSRIATKKTVAYFTLPIIFSCSLHFSRNRWVTSCHFSTTHSRLGYYSCAFHKFLSN